MGKEFKIFLIREAILTSIIIAIGFIIFSTFLKTYYLPVYFIILAVVSILTALFYWGLLKNSKENSVKFISNFMLYSGIKMIAYLVFITSYVFTFKEKATYFLIVFSVLYIIYTAFDVFLMYKNFKSNQ